MTEISDDAWLALVEFLQEIDAGDEVHFAHLTDDTLGESEVLAMLEQAADLGMIEQTDARTWKKREPVIDNSPREE